MKKIYEPMERGMNDLLGLGSTFIPSTIWRIGLIELTAKEDGWMSQLDLGCPWPLLLTWWTRPLREEWNGEEDSGGVEGRDEDGDSDVSEGDEGEGFIFLFLSKMVIRGYCIWRWKLLIQLQST